MSHNADLFSQKGLGPRSKGKITQIGYASFFPYDEEVKFTRDKDMNLDGLEDIFGPDITMGGVPEAGELPSGFKPPLMKTLTKGPICIIHKVKMEWTPNDATLTEEVIKRKKGGLEEIVDMNRPEKWHDEEVETAGIRGGWE